MNELKDEAERIVAELPIHPVGSKEHMQALAALERVLSLIPPEEKEEKWYDKIIKNGPLVTAASGIIGTCMVLYNERAEIITSRAFGWIRWK